MITVESFHPHNLGWLEVQLDHHEVDHLWKCIEEPLKDWKQKLIGQIDSSYLISDKGNWFFKNVLVELCKNYRDIFFNIGRDYPTTNTHPYTLKRCGLIIKNKLSLIQYIVTQEFIVLLFGCKFLLTIMIRKKIL